MLTVDIVVADNSRVFSVPVEYAEDYAKKDVYVKLVMAYEKVGDSEKVAYYMKKIRNVMRRIPACASNMRKVEVK